MLNGLRVPTPIHDLLIGQSDIQLSIKRDDLNHPSVQGNKWRKLKYNLEKFSNGNYTRIISFGGVFSNHVYALASAAWSLEIPCTLFLRGYDLDENNPTVQFLKHSRADIRLLGHQAYREKESTDFIDSLKKEFENPLIIPEGGTDHLGIKGTEELGKEIVEQCGTDLPDYVCVSAGTGGTAAGLIKAFNSYKTQVIVFSSLKGDFLKDDIARLSGSADFILNVDYHFKGYAKFNSELIDFINSFKEEYSIPLEPVYTGKMMYGIMDLAKKQYFQPKSKVMVIHTGGLQGIKGYNYRYAEKYGRII